MGTPPEHFYTNSSECINHVIKAKVDYKNNELPQFIDKLQELTTEQQQEVEKAVVGVESTMPTAVILNYLRASGLRCQGNKESNI